MVWILSLDLLVASEKMIHCDNKIRHQTRVLKKSSKSITIHILIWKVNILNFSLLQWYWCIFIFLSVCMHPPLAICSDWVSALKNSFINPYKHTWLKIDIYAMQCRSELLTGLKSYVLATSTHIRPTFSQTEVIRPTFLQTRVAFEPPSCKLA